MDSFYFNKIAAAVLCALLLAFGGTTLLEMMDKEHAGGHAEAAYALPEPSESAGGGETKQAEFSFEANVAPLLAAATPAAGEAVFKKCASCHTANKGGKNGIGPNLWNVVGNERGSHADFSYSKAMKAKGGHWDYPSITMFVHSPGKWLKGTKMAFSGIKSDKDLANLLAYLQTASDSPKPFPKVEAAKAEDTKADGAKADDKKSEADGSKPAANDGAEKKH